MAADDQRYAPVNDGREFPPITQVQALRVARTIVRRFGRKAEASANVERDMRLPTKARRCWAATKPTRGLDSGWQRLIHDLSHMVFSYRHPRFRAHEAGHATLEREIRDYIIAKDLVTYVAPKPRPPASVLRAAKLTKAIATEARWVRKSKLAATKLKKARARVRVLQRQMAAADAAEVQA